MHSKIFTDKYVVIIVQMFAWLSRKGLWTMHQEWVYIVMQLSKNWFGSTFLLEQILNARTMSATPTLSVLRKARVHGNASAGTSWTRTCAARSFALPVSSFRFAALHKTDVYWIASHCKSSTPANANPKCSNDGTCSFTCKSGFKVSPDGSECLPFCSKVSDCPTNGPDNR